MRENILSVVGQPETKQMQEMLPEILKEVGPQQYGFLKDIIEERTLTTAFPETETVYDWCFNIKDKKYILWNDTITHTPHGEPKIGTKDAPLISYR